MDTRMERLLALGDDPPNDLRVIIRDLLAELKRRDVSEQQIKGVEIALKIAFALGEKNAALRMAKGAVTIGSVDS